MEENEKVVDVEVKDVPNENISSPKNEAPVRESWSKYETFSIVSLVLGVNAIELAFICWLPVYGIILTIVALGFSIPGYVLGRKAKYDGRKRMRTLKSVGPIVNLVAIIASAVGLVISIIVTILVINGMIQNFAEGLNSALSSSATSTLLALL